jgi:hypothetical protein
MRTRNYDHSAIAEKSLDIGFRGILVIGECP